MLLWLSFQSPILIGAKTSQVFRWSTHRRSRIGRFDNRDSVSGFGQHSGHDTSGRTGSGDEKVEKFDDFTSQDCAAASQA
jgi:hypothetical protein